MTVDETDKEFERLWNAIDPLWKCGDKRDAKFFWLKGRAHELVQAQIRTDDALEEINKRNEPSHENQAS